MEYTYLLLLLGVVIALCVLINRMTDRLKIPSLLLFIGLGIVFGVILRPQIGNFTDYALGNVVCSVCLVFVIFYGGLGTKFKEARPVAPRAVLLSSLGTALTAGITGAGVYGIFRLLRPEALRGRHVLIVDDVVTTGASLISCGKAIAAAGDVRLSILALALAGDHPLMPRPRRRLVAGTDDGPDRP